MVGQKFIGQQFSLSVFVPLQQDVHFLSFSFYYGHVVMLGHLCRL